MKYGCAILVLIATSICVSPVTSVEFDLFKTCSAIGEEARCTLGIRQAQLDAAVDCTDLVYANYFSRICSRNRNGDTCGLIGAYHTDFLKIMSDCVGSIGQCSSECRNLMQTLQDELGCCINAVYNYTGSFFEPILAPAFNYSLWSACGVEPVVDNCTGELPFSLPPNSVSRCSLSVIQTRILSEWCNPTPFDRLRAIIDDHEGCEVFLEFQTDVCSLDRNGEYCHSTAAHFNYVTAIMSNCNFSSDSCSPDCKRYYQGFADDHGCCVHAIFNSTFAAIQGQDHDIFAEETKWIQCGVKSPPTNCEQPSVGNGMHVKVDMKYFILILCILVFSVSLY